MLRDYINTTITFTELGKRLNKSSKSIHRMLGPEGNPRMDSIVGILKVLQDEEHIRLRAEFGIDAIRIPNRCEVKRELASGPPHRDIESFGKRAKRRFNFEDE